MIISFLVFLQKWYHEGKLEIVEDQWKAEYQDHEKKS